MERKITMKLLSLFEQYLVDNEKSKSTVEKYMRDIKHFTAYAGECAIDKSLTLAYKAELGKEYAVSSANSMLAALNTFLKFAGWYECCVKQFKVQKKIYCSEETELSKEEYIRLIKAARQKGNERLFLMIQTICGTGIRIGELQHITIEAIEKGEAMVTCKGKTRVVFIVTALKNRLLEYAKDQNITSGAVFVTRTGKPMDRSNVWREMKNLCKQANVPEDKVFPHNLRHLFARTFYDIEKDIAKLADILGHASINTTRIYIITTGEEHRRKMENMKLVI